MAIARHFFASSTLMAEAGWAIDKYAVRARTINVLKPFANFAIGTTYSLLRGLTPLLSGQIRPAIERVWNSKTADDIGKAPYVLMPAPQANSTSQRCLLHLKQ